MKITRIETTPVRLDIDRRVGTVADTKGFRFQSHILVVRLFTDDGLEGLGEVNGTPDWSGETAAGARALIDGHLAPRLIGADPRRIRECVGRLGRTVGNPFAKAGLEMALFDLLGKALGVPVYQLLGGPVRSRDIPLRFAVIPVGPVESAAVAARMVAEGIRTIKMKVGHDAVPHDLERVRRVREAVGPDVRLSVDANGGWSVNEAILASRALEEFDVAFVEQPVHRLDLDGLAEVRRRTSLPVMADESVFTPQDALACIARRAADIISVYPGKNGGILDAVTIVGMAEAAGVACAIGSNMEWDIASSAMAHLAIALPNIAVERYAADIPGPFYHVQHALRSGCSYVRGTLSVPDLPGLGVVLDETLLAALRT